MLTEIERKTIQGILDSEFMDNGPEADRPVWTWSANPFSSKRTFSGAVSSLVKKGFVQSTDEGDDSVILVTQAGWNAFYN